MIRVIKICRKCGAKIFSDAPRGLCTACVLETALGILPDAPVAADQENEAANRRMGESARPPSPRFADSPFQSVPMLGELGDYELLEEIGRGGQGVVFRARQKSLNRTVALKVISLGQWASKAHLKRFRREAEAAASLDHPCIVPIYEVGERDGSCYFSMKFVEGGQLDEVVRRTPMSIRQAAELIAKVARTVHYAHEHGILHRDIKPGNILLDAKGEPHLTDFGLARLVESESSVTQTLDVLGTPSYMAPEQAVGNNAAVSSATDVYGLGAVLYQLLTRHPPFAGGTTYETIKLLESTEPRPPRLLNPKVDRDISTICLKCLEKDPKRRYSSALALAEDLERWLKHEPIVARHTGIFARGRKWVRRNPTSALLAASLFALAAAAGWIVWKSELVRHPVTNGVAVLPFENLSGDPDNAYFANGIQEEILTRLAGIAALKVISRVSTQQYQSKPRNLREIARQLGVAHIVEGSVQKASNQVRVNVQLINAQTDSHLWADTYDRKLTDIFGVESEVAKGIAEALQAKLSGREERALAVKPTSNPEAYDAYLRGLGFDARSVYEPSWDARSSYERAVQLDPKFASAWARLCRADGLLYTARNETHRNLAATADEAKRALENAQKLDPNSPETLLALGYYQYWVLRDYGVAKTTFGRVGKLLPGRSEAPYALGRVMRREGNWTESIPYFEQALALDPRNVELLFAAAMTHVALKQFPAALKFFDRLLDIKPDDRVINTKARIYQAMGNLQEAAKLLSGINETSSEDAFLTKASQLQFERNYGELVRLQQARVKRDGSDFGAQLDLALYQRLSGDLAGAKVTAEQARDTLEPLYRDKPDNPGYAGSLSVAYACIGEKELALQLAERAVANNVTGPGFEENLALVQTMVGENNRAISTLTRLLQKVPYPGTMYGLAGITPTLLRIDPLWDPLRGDPSFQKLCEEKQP
jgi:TolB-like protein/thioredoxin-like negative regulator of GroEL